MKTPKIPLHIKDKEELRAVVRKVLETGAMNYTLMFNPAMLLDDEVYKILEDLAEFHPETQRRIKEKNDAR